MKKFLQKLFYYCLHQKPFCSFLEEKKIFFYFEFSFWHLFFDVLYKDGFRKSKKILIFKVPVIFKKHENIPLCRRLQKRV